MSLQTTTSPITKENRQLISSPIPSRRLPSLMLPLLTFNLFCSLITFVSPDQTSLQFAVYFCAFTTGVILLLEVWRVWRGGSLPVGRIILLTGLLYWFWLGATQSAFARIPFATPDSLYPGFGATVPYTIVATGLFVTNLFALTAIIGWRIAPQPYRMIRTLAERIDPPSTAWLDLVALLLALLAWIPLYISYRGDLAAAFSDLLLMRAGAVRGSADVAILQHLHLLGVFGGALAIGRSAMNSKGFRPARYTAIVVMLPLVFLGQASRFNLGFLLLPAILVLLLAARNRQLWRQRRFKFIAIFALVSGLVLFQGAVRNQGLTDYQQRSNVQDTLETGLYGHDHFGALLVSIDFARRQGHFNEFMAPFFLTHYIPRVIWPGKPEIKSWTAFNQAWTQGHQFNVTPSVTGQYYLNWGIPGVIYIGLFLGWLARFSELWFSQLDIRRQFLSATACGLLFSFIFLSFRIFHPLYFAYPLFGFLAYWLISRKQTTRRS